MKFIDTHSHLYSEQFENDLRQSTERTTNSGSALFGANKNIFEQDLTKKTSPQWVHWKSIVQQETTSRRLSVVIVHSPLLMYQQVVHIHLH